MDKPTLWLRFILKSCHKQPLVVPNQGWTLIEIGAITVIVGILAAMSYPSMAGMQGRNELRSTMSSVKAAFQEAQRNAIKRGFNCTVNITPGTGSAGTIRSTTTTGCVNNPVAMPNTVTLSVPTVTPPTTPTNVIFSYKGNTVVSRTVLLVSTRANERRCLRISQPLGVIRSGYYDATATDVENQCKSSL